MGDKNQKKIQLHHSQRDNKLAKRVQKAEERRVNFEIRRSWFTAKIEGERNALTIAGLTFLIGLLLLLVCLVYATGVILYG